MIVGDVWDCVYAYVLAETYRAGFIPQGKYLHNQWEMKSDSISMHNPAWNKFVQKIAVKAARDLGTKSDAGAVAAKLAKAHLWAADARMPPHKAWVIQIPLNCFFH